MTKEVKSESRAKSLVNVEVSKFYKLVPPPEGKLLSDEWKLPVSKLGAEAKRFADLKLALDEIKEDLRDTAIELLSEFKKSGKKEITFQHGETIRTLKEKHTNERFDVEMKEA